MNRKLDLLTYLGTKTERENVSKNGVNSPFPNMALLFFCNISEQFRHTDHCHLAFCYLVDTCSDLKFPIARTFWL